MLKDLYVFKEIRQKVNSGIYKYRTEQQIDSIYNWAENKIKNLSTHRDFYNLISILTDFEGSLHNSTSIPDKKWQNMRKENDGYFPLPINWIQGKWLVNFKNGEIKKITYSLGLSYGITTYHFYYLNNRLIPVGK